MDSLYWEPQGMEPENTKHLRDAIGTQRYLLEEIGTNTKIKPRNEVKAWGTIL